jgi:predicted RNA-binding Zn-ribbon protein involved in translation (DUF1610 family)
MRRSMSDENRSTFEHLKSRYDETELRCPECGFFDENGEWKATTDGGTVEYHHICPSCGVKQTRVMDRS